MKYTETEAEKILERLVASTRSPKGRFSAKESYKLLERRLPVRKTHLFRIRTFRTIAAAAAIALLCVMSWAAYEYVLPVGVQTVSTLADCRTIELPDGTQVTLNHFSSLTYPKRFRGTYRKVVLGGEGYFEVSKDKKHPFVVEAGEVNVQVLGTHFNIEAYTNNPDIKTTLFEGSVAVSIDGGSERLVLRPNESAIYNKVEKDLTLKTVENASEEIAWQKGAFIFNKLPLEEIARELSNSFGVEIEIDDAALRDYHLTARFDQEETLEDILSLLQTGRGFTFRPISKNKIIITKDSQ